MLDRRFLIVAAAIFSTAAWAQEPRIRVGTIECSVPKLSVVRASPAVRLPTASPAAPVADRTEITVGCEFMPSDPDLPHGLYEGRFDLEAPIQAQDLTGKFEWTVFANREVTTAILTGGYSNGLEGDPVALGLGRDVLVGGGDNLIALQPGDMERGSLAANVGVMELEFVRCEPAGDAC